MTADADQIVQGRVVSKTAAYEADKAIWTTYSVEVSETVKTKAATPPKQVVIKQLGGTVGDLTLEASGIPHFSVGDEAILFTKDYGAGWQSVANGPQGAQRVVTQTTLDSSGKTTQHQNLPSVRSFFREIQSTDADAFKASIRSILADLNYKTQN